MSSSGVPLGPLVYVGDIVSYYGIKSEVVKVSENGIGTDDFVELADGRGCWASDLDVPAKAPQPNRVSECHLNPVFQGLYEWGDGANTKVELHRDGSATITQGDKTIQLDCFGFFRDVVKVFDLAIDAMPEGDTKMTMSYKALGTSRSFPSCSWD